jgi:hypothetical protein
MDEPVASGSASERRPGLALFAAINALAAWGGAIGLITGTLGLGGIEERLPFESTVLAGIALAVVVACPLTVLAWSAWTGSHATGTVALVAGVMVIGWIVVQIAILRTFSPFQPAYLIVGAILIAMSGRVGPGRR